MSDERAPREAKDIWDFAKDFLVTCPSCARRATVRRGEPVFVARLTCPACGFVREMNEPYAGHLYSYRPGAAKPGVIVLGAPVDPYLHLDLWLRVDCAGEVLWAYNAQHVAFLAAYVGAKLRERPVEDNPHGLRNQLLESRLPKWMTLAKNRAAVLTGVERLQQRLLLD